MDIGKVNWSLFRSFLAVVDTGSLLGAARRLGSYQPTLSRHISELEDQLGVVLFERTGRGLTPTSAGRAIVEPARRMAAAAADVQAQVRGASAIAAGVVRVAASEVVAAHILPRCLSAMIRENPQIQVEVVASNQMSNLLRREADIAVRMVRPSQSNLTAKKIGDLSLGLFASRDYVSARGVPSTLEDLPKHSLVGLDKDDSLILGLRRQGLSIDRESFSVRTDNQVAYIEMIRSGAGIGVIPRVIGRAIDDIMDVSVGASSSLPVWMVVHREIHDSPLIRSVFDRLSLHIANFVD